VIGTNTPRFVTGLRVRLVIGFLIVVAIALGLMLASLPRLLDGYFEDQAEEDLERRTGEIRLLVARELLRYQTGGEEAPRPILQPTEPLTIAPGVRETLGTPESGFVRELAELIALANVTVTIADAAEPEQTIYELYVPVPDEFAREGQQRDALALESNFEIQDLFWTQAGAAAPERLVTVRLSEPFTYRAQTLETIVGVMIVAAVIALIAAVITSILIADRLSNPIRRLTGAARELSEGHLSIRVPPPGSAPEISDLTAAFNAMAARVQNSIEFIRRDRDRGRDFLADVSHELRTPIAALRTFNELLLVEGQVADAETRQEFLEQSRQQIERLDWLATNLLELSKLDSGLVLLDLRPDDLRVVVEDAVQQARPSAERKGIELLLNVPNEALRQRHDPQRMGQVLGNLIGNAIKFTPSGGHVEVTLEETEKGAEVRVADTGVGIDARELPFVFERFYRGSEAGESRAAGSGLGLSIVRSIVEMHNGRVTISSARGKGTQVSVALPRDVSVSSPTAARA
jgi:signal transduction histidine kinase